MELPRPIVLVLVAVGGAVGTLVRYTATREWPTSVTGFPRTTFAVNVLGAFALGALVATTRRPRSANLWRRPLIGTGFLGGLTTFSTMCVEAVRLADHDRVATAAAYLVASVVVGVAAAWVGMKVTR